MKKNYLIEKVLFQTTKFNFDRLNRALSGKTILITGASSGIGEQLAYLLAAIDCRLILVARRTEKLTMMKKEIDKLDFPPVGEFMEMIVDTGANVYGCKMSMDMMKLTEADLIDGAQVLGAMEFMEITEGAQVLFV